MSETLTTTYATFAATLEEPAATRRRGTGPQFTGAASRSHLPDPTPHVDSGPSGRYRGVGVRGGKTHGTCNVCGRPTERVSSGWAFRRTCSNECMKASGRPAMVKEVLERRRREAAEGGRPEYAPPAVTGPRMAPRTCVLCNRPAPEGLTRNVWREGDEVHVLDDWGAVANDQHALEPPLENSGAFA